MDFSMKKEVETPIFSVTYVEDYIDTLENLPGDIQLKISRIRELDSESQNYKADLRANMAILMDLDVKVILTEEEKELFTSIQDRIRRHLESLQQIGDEKVKAACEIREFTENRLRLLDAVKKTLEKSSSSETQTNESILHQELKVREAPAKSAARPSDSPQSPSKSKAVPTPVVATPQSPSTSAAAYAKAQTPSTSAAAYASNQKPSTSAAANASNQKPSTSADAYASNQKPSTSATPVDKEKKKSTSTTTTRTQKRQYKQHPEKKQKAKKTAAVKKKKTRQIDDSPPMNIPAQADVSEVESDEPEVEPVEPEVEPVEPEVEPVDADTRYCSCNGFSDGPMVGCDNNLCPIDWYHFDCVGVTVVEPERKWYCPLCRFGNNDEIMKPKSIFLEALARYNREREERDALRAANQ